MGALANVSIAFASFGMTNESELDSWSNIRQGTIRNLKDDSLQLDSVESLVLILSSLQIVDECFTKEELSANQDLIEAIVSSKAIQKLPVSETSTLFATLSRYI